MIKHIMLIIALSIAAIFFQDQLDYVLKLFLSLHDKALSYLGTLISNSQTGQLVQSVLVLVLYPVAAVAVVAASYWAIKRSTMPYLAQAVWVVWFILLTAVALQGV